MDYLQYLIINKCLLAVIGGFKPYYKWITFNIKQIINATKGIFEESFKPYYKWITFNIPAFLLLGEGYPVF